MFYPCSNHRAKRFIAAGLLLCLGAVTAAAQGVAEPVLKAAFLYNFTKFTEWPADSLPPNARLVMCVADPAVAAALAGAVAGRSVGDHVIELREVAPTDALRGCHVLYIAGLDAKASARLIESLQGAPVLSVSDSPAFTARGGVGYLFQEDGRMRFAINVAATQRVRLRMSSQLLELARIVTNRPGDVGRR